MNKSCYATLPKLKKKPLHQAIALERYLDALAERRKALLGQCTPEAIKLLRQSRPELFKG